jgi:MFS family permease
MEKQTYKSFIRNYLLSSSLYHFVFAYAIYNLLFNIRGLSVFEISILLAWWGGTSMLFEIPSGALADYWSRKKMLVIAPIIKSLCFVTWFLADGNFYLYGLGFLLWSISGSMISGTTEALLYDELVIHNKKSEYEKILSKKVFWQQNSIGFASAIGGGIAYLYSMDIVLIFSLIPLLLSAYFAFCVIESPKVKSTEEIHYVEYFKLAFQEIKGNKILLILLIYSFGISIWGQIEEFEQLYFKLSALPLFLFGVVVFFERILIPRKNLSLCLLIGKNWISL